MASTRYIGYVGGVAVAVGVGAAIAAASQGTAHADANESGSTASNESTSSTGSTSTTTGSVNAGPKKADADSGTERPKPFSKLNDQIQKVAAEVTKPLTSAKKPDATPATAKKPKPGAEEFEATQVKRLKDLFEPREAAAPTPKQDSAPENEPTAKSAVETAPTVTSSAVEDQAVVAAEPWSPNPFRPDDPVPTDMPDEILAIRDALLATPIPDQLKPFVREGFEAAYRGSQIVPWVNVVVPLGKILPELPAALPDTDEARDARQIIVNELLVTTPPVSLLYYGYDEIVDLLNIEKQGQDLKEGFYVEAWNILDPFEILHNKGESGLGQAAGAESARL